MRYEISTPSAIENVYNGWDTTQFISENVAAGMTIKEAIAAQVDSSNERIDEDEFDAYWDESLAAQVYEDLYREALKDDATNMWLIASGSESEEVVHVDDFDTEDCDFRGRVVRFDNADYYLELSEGSDYVREVKELA